MPSRGLKQTWGLTLQPLEHSHVCWGDNIARVAPVSAFCWHRFSSPYKQQSPFSQPSAHLKLLLVQLLLSQLFQLQGSLESQPPGQVFVQLLVDNKHL